MANGKAIPDGYHSLQPYLILKDCAKAIAFYEAAFGAKERMQAKRPDGRVQHAEMQVGDCVVMMADEAPEMNALSIQHFGGSPVNFYLYVDDCDKVYAQAIAAGATSISEPKDQHYGDRNAGVKDPFGFQWWIGTHIKDMGSSESQGLPRYDTVP